MRDKKTELTIIICTRNRAFILLECLESLLNQTISANQYNIVVVDNGSKDETERLVEELVDRHTNLRYVFEPEVGLSYARNRGWKESNTSWVGYLDDDARVPEGFVARALWVIENYDFDCFGGMYYPWYRYGKPKWLPENFGTKEKLTSTISKIDGGFLSGGNFFVKRELLEMLGGFNGKLGMAFHMGYGEEEELQSRIRANGFSIGFDPDLEVEHCVLPHKLRISWHLVSAFAHGRDSERLYFLNTPITAFGRLGWAVIKSIFILFPIGGGKVLFQRGYYFQNFLLDLFTPIFLHIGKLTGTLCRRRI